MRNRQPRQHSPVQRVGSALIEAVREAARRSGCSRVWLVTTNDNLNALRFYQKRGFVLVAFHRNALETSRRLKPEIPLIGTDGIPLRDELELELVLQQESGKASMPGGASKILLLGDPRLRAVCAAVTDVTDPAFIKGMRDLQDALRTFRTSHGFGRAIAAPQIGIPKRLVAIEIGRGPSVLINPEITWKSEETFTMWDDCMCFPFLLVRVRRHGSISIAYTDEGGSRREWSRLDQATSELLQHELDHLDGVLAIDNALDRDSIISRAAFEADPQVFRAKVEYVIASD